MFINSYFRPKQSSINNHFLCMGYISIHADSDTSLKCKDD